ncbi:hypothetical protein TBLA_0B05640 [Henningerozyma blattae CBS 6284]|uniref:Uncharacterized protein n=1 Tax=Henningerozyma blattae (strain ATCC 34711 / CBS 6284 / DSM 70876 / NBRC 10599 / NRRL Y-10934 / UCD 77-7) TaxID=1071380 RepID=I2GZ39_HENB6|nr:hypothetical protein TBLA_0B05640 [Tetrapisispora blattae CBS 6284]CCH59391.1 hypothetical protein TBLA_0B05640 [Tetrapisispora blattae CBS 6284]
MSHLPVSFQSYKLENGKFIYYPKFNLDNDIKNSDDCFILFTDEKIPTELKKFLEDFANTNEIITFTTRILDFTKIKKIILQLSCLDIIEVRNILLVKNLMILKWHTLFINFINKNLSFNKNNSITNYNNSFAKFGILLCLKSIHSIEYYSIQRLLIEILQFKAKTGLIQGTEELSVGRFQVLVNMVKDQISKDFLEFQNKSKEYYIGKVPYDLKIYLTEHELEFVEIFKNFDKDINNFNCMVINELNLATNFDVELKGILLKLKADISNKFPKKQELCSIQPDQTLKKVLDKPFKIIQLSNQNQLSKNFWKRFEKFNNDVFFITCLLLNSLANVLEERETGSLSLFYIINLLVIIMGIFVLEKTFATFLKNYSNILRVKD